MPLSQEQLREAQGILSAIFENHVQRLATLQDLVAGGTSYHEALAIAGEPDVENNEPQAPAALGADPVAELVGDVIDHDAVPGLQPAVRNAAIVRAENDEALRLAEALDREILAEYVMSRAAAVLPVPILPAADLAQPLPVQAPIEAREQLSPQMQYNSSLAALVALLKELDLIDAGSEDTMGWDALPMNGTPQEQNVFIVAMYPENKAKQVMARRVFLRDGELRPAIEEVQTARRNLLQVAHLENPAVSAQSAAESPVPISPLVVATDVIKQVTDLVVDDPVDPVNVTEAVSKVVNQPDSKSLPKNTNFDVAANKTDKKIPGFFARLFTTLKNIIVEILSWFSFKHNDENHVVKVARLGDHSSQIPPRIIEDSTIKSQAVNRRSHHDNGVVCSRKSLR